MLMTTGKGPAPPLAGKYRLYVRCAPPTLIVCFVNPLAAALAFAQPAEGCAGAVDPVSVIAADVAVRRVLAAVRSFAEEPDEHATRITTAARTAPPKNFTSRTPAP